MFFIYSSFISFSLTMPASKNLSFPVTVSQRQNF